MTRAMGRDEVSDLRRQLEEQSKSILELQMALTAAAGGHGASEDGNPVGPPAVGTPQLATVRPSPPPLSVTTHLRAPSIERFSGDRETSVDFLLAIDRRLEATGQMDTLNGLEFATGHFLGYAAVWWRCFALQHPEIRSWQALRAHFAIEFELVAEKKIFEERLMACAQTGSVEDYVTEFLGICARLPDVADDFKQRCFARKANAYLRDKFATRDFPSLLDMVRFTLGLVPVVDAAMLLPDGAVAPVVAAMPARTDGKYRFAGKCHSCGKAGHKAINCRSAKKNAGSSGLAPRGKSNFGKYDGSGRVHAVAATHAETDDLSDDDLRQGNGQA